VTVTLRTVATLEVRRLQISARTSDSSARSMVSTPRNFARRSRAWAELPFRWQNHRERGLRAILVVAVGEQAVQVVLYPALDEGADVWNLGSAYAVGS